MKTAGSFPLLHRVRRAALLGSDQLWDLVIINARISSLQPSVLTPDRFTTHAERSPHADDETVSLDAAGCLVLPGLHDHHLHLFSLAAAMASVDCSPAATPDHASFGRALADATVGADGTVRGFGYYESTAGDLTRELLDTIRADVPVRIQHRSGVAWFLNSAALHRVDRGDHPDGRLFRVDDGLAFRLRRPGTTTPGIDLRHVSAVLAAHGVTHLTDATPYNSDAALQRLMDQKTTGRILQHLGVMGSPAVHSATIGVSRPAAKIIIDEARAPSFDSVRTQIMLARAQDLPVAIHLTDRSTTWLALSALHEVGSVQGDRIEHGSVLDHQAVLQCAALGLTVVTNPALAYERARDHAAQTDADDQAHLWRCGSLIDAGVQVLGATDAPYGSADPWASISAAVDRTAGSQRVGSDRDLTPLEAIGLFLHAPRLNVGMSADLAVTSTTEAELMALIGARRSPAVRHTVVGGRMVTP